MVSRVCQEKNGQDPDSRSVAKFIFVLVQINLIMNKVQLKQL